MSEYKNARNAMIEGQLRPNRITDPMVLAAFAAVERENFVTPLLRGAAYVDAPIAVGRGRSMIEPVMLARMLQEATIGLNDRVLDIGCATGYAAALAARLAAAVVATDPEVSLIERARVALAGSTNVTLANADPADGFPAEAPYDVILIEGAVTAVPASLSDQLAEGGRLLCAIQSGSGNAGELVLIERIGMAISRRKLCDAWLKPLPGLVPEQAFAL